LSSVNTLCKKLLLGLGPLSRTPKRVVLKLNTTYGVILEVALYMREYQNASQNLKFAKRPMEHQGPKCGGGLYLSGKGFFLRIVRLRHVAGWLN
jgi:hypothetical protein